MKTSIFFAAALLLPLAGTADETFRCGNWIASSTMSVSELTQKCGEPSSRTTETRDVTSRNRNNGLMVVVGQSTVETWIYERGQNAAMVVTIVDGRIKSIERQN